MTAELGRIAAAIAIPVDVRGIAASPVVLVHHRPGEKPGTGTTTYRVAFPLEAGQRRSAPVGPTFTRPRQALALAQLLDRHAPASRPAPTAIPAAASQVTTRKDDLRASGNPSEPTEAPGTPDLAVGGGGRMCVVCGSPVPAGSRADRRTCSGACREALSAQRARASAEDAPADVHGGATGGLTPMRPSSVVGPKSSRAPGPPPASASSRRSDLRQVDRPPRAVENANARIPATAGSGALGPEG